MKPQVLLAGACALLVLIGPALKAGDSPPRMLRVGVAGHAFDHLGAIGDQAVAAAANGATIIYVSGLGALGYQGLPPEQEVAERQQATRTYIRQAKRQGIRLAIGYVCATSMVKLDTFDRHWPAELRARFHTAPGGWRQQDRAGNPLSSWYGGDYQPACMNNPDWRAYERFVVRLQLESGCDGIFFDNPTVHPQGCYCRWCMEKFGRYLKQAGLFPASFGGPGADDLARLRGLARTNAAAFLRFRCMIARDFLAEMRAYARTLNPHALVTANNSLNSPEALFSQCHGYAYNIFEMSLAEDFVVVEDMQSQARLLPNGETIEYTSTYKQLRAISHGKPVVAITLAEADYHTPPHLVRLAMAEAAGNGCSYLSWPTWPEAERSRMIHEIRPQADFLRAHAELFNGARPRTDVLLFLPFRDWVRSDRCRASDVALQLSRANTQFEVICEDALGRLAKPPPNAPVLLAAKRADFTPEELKMLERFTHGGGTLLTAETSDWFERVKTALGQRSISVQGGANVRALVCDEPHRTIVHLLNLNVERFSSFEDKVNPVSDLHIRLRVPFKRVREVRALTADTAASSGLLSFSTAEAGPGSMIELTLPKLEVSTILLAR